MSIAKAPISPMLFVFLREWDIFPNNEWKNQWSTYRFFLGGGLNKNKHQAKIFVNLNFFKIKVYLKMCAFWNKYLLKY